MIRIRHGNSVCEFIVRRVKLIANLLVDIDVQRQGAIVRTIDV